MSEGAAEVAAGLKSKPTLTQLRELLVKLEKCGLSTPNPALADAFSTLLIEVVPTFATEIDLFVPVFSSVVGLACLCSRLRVPLLATEQETLGNLLESVLAQNDALITRLWHENEKEARALIWGSRLLASAATLSSSWVGDPAQYSRWLSTQMLKLDWLDDGELVDKATKLGKPMDAITPFLKDTGTFAVLVRLWPSMRSSHQRFVLVHGLLPSVADAQPQNIAAILLALPEIRAHTIVLAKYSIASSTAIQRAVVTLARSVSTLDELCDYCIGQWSDSTVFQTTPLELQRAWAQLCVLCAINLTPAQAQAKASTEQFLNGVSAHLESSSDSVRQFGTIVAQVFNRVAGHELDFGIEYDAEWVVIVDNPVSSLEDALLGNQEVAETTDKKELIEHKPSTKDSDDEPAKDSDDDDSDTEEVVDAPFYIKDLYLYLTDRESAPKVQSALTHGSGLIKRKVTLGLQGEVAQYAARLLKGAAGLTDQYNLDDFANKRQLLMSTTLAAVPTEAPELVRLLVSGEWSLSMRITIMATMALAAHELSGTDSAEIEQLQLPSAQHKAFASDVDRLSQNLQTKLVISASTSDSGQVIRRSAALGKSKRIVPSKYAKIAHTFFFPLAAISPRALAPSNSAGYAVVVRAQWIKTLGYLLWSAYPTSTRIEDMARELVSLALAEFRHQAAAGGRLETVTEEALYTAVLYVTEIAPNAIGLEQREELSTWVAASWQTANDERVKQLGAAVLVKLTS